MPAQRGALRGGARGWFETAFFSTADNSAQPYSLSVPRDYDKRPDYKWPVVIGLHGAGGTHGGEKGYEGSPEITEYLYLLPLGRGPRVGYGRLSAIDVLQALRDVQAHYRVDPDRVYLFGGSMGGYGTYEIASHWPDLFAACRPVCGGGAWWPLEQMCNLPTVIHHGLQDLSVDFVQLAVCGCEDERAGCPVQVYLHPGFGHRVTPMSSQISPWERFRAIRRDTQPRTVVIDSDLAMLRKAYWLSIPRPVDPQDDAYLRATFIAANHLALGVRNVEWARIDLPPKWVDPGEPLQITTDTGDLWTEIVTGPAKALYLHWAAGKLAATTQPTEKVEDPTIYTGGGANNLFWLGRPVRIVYGTAGSAEQTETLRKLAESICKYSEWDEEFAVGGYPVLADTEVTEPVLKTCDLIVLGGPETNRLMGRMAASTAGEGGGRQGGGRRQAGDVLVARPGVFQPVLSQSSGAGSADLVVRRDTGPRRLRQTRRSDRPACLWRARTGVDCGDPAWSAPGGVGAARRRLAADAARAAAAGTRGLVRAHRYGQGFW